MLIHPSDPGGDDVKPGNYPFKIYDKEKNRIRSRPQTPKKRLICITSSKQRTHREEAITQSNFGELDRYIIK